jgi:glyoxylase-like metal-dependent hydrolase (beta-lactamase superfamily II)
VTDGVELKQFSVGDWDNNVYILVDRATGTSVLFDAPTDAGRILQALEGTKPAYILMTHADQDHVGALDEVRRATGAPVGAHSAEAERMPSPPDFELQDGQVLPLGDSQIRVMYTPGHSPGGVSFLVGDILIAGDTLFPGGPGNTKRPDGSFDDIVSSIQSKLFVLPDETKVYPGHGSATTIGDERPHLQEWIDRGW